MQRRKNEQTHDSPRGSYPQPLPKSFNTRKRPSSQSQLSRGDDDIGLFRKKHALLNQSLMALLLTLLIATSMKWFSRNGDDVPQSHRDIFTTGTNNVSEMSTTTTGPRGGNKQNAAPSLRNNNPATIVTTPPKGKKNRISRASEEASAAMLHVTSRFVDGEKKLKKELLKLMERQKNGKDVGVDHLTSWKGDDVPVWTPKDPLMGSRVFGDNGVVLRLAHWDNQRSSGWVEGSLMGVFEIVRS
eukprot:CAMPEP_0172496584 /NCGR_PEP_ID=MMETSP1066-20121228/89801_1 /TAXON_ID=671091 /ORGANISM="Coscinodiscus wailesii, Strain CCMP2513" /LENGTH=242 /DNA_ID=CAMNT_0013268953 /DNA_START=65 /DNA_END=797 /DNA_ORIENTATION=+